MFTKINNPRSFPGGDNKGSASTLINYLEKENVGKDTLEKEFFFSFKCDQEVHAQCISASIGSLEEFNKKAGN